jgi:uncharacterized protein YcaQ
VTETLNVRQARRLALVRGGLLKPRWTGLPRRASGSGGRARKGAHAVLGRYGYLQLDTVSVAGARSHTLVLLSRLKGVEPEVGESLLQPGEPVFEYWGHEASWLPMDLYPAFEWRRREYRVHPWWGDLLGKHRDLAAEIVERIERQGPLRSLDLEGEGSGPWWGLKIAKKVVSALWSAGDLAVRERRNFQRSFDLTERVIPEAVRARPLGFEESLRHLLLRALAGHGWAQTGTLAQTWRLRNLRREITTALEELREAGEILPCDLVDRGGKQWPGWIRPRDLETAKNAGKLRPRRDRGVLLSPFDPVLWDRARTLRLFHFEQVLEIFKPAEQRVYGYYCLPVLAGDRLVARVDLKADRGAGRLHVLSRHFEADPPTAADREAVGTALVRYAEALKFSVQPPG